MRNVRWIRWAQERRDVALATAVTEAATKANAPCVGAARPLPVVWGARRSPHRRNPQLALALTPPLAFVSPSRSVDCVPQTEASVHRPVPTLSLVLVCVASEVAAQNLFGGLSEALSEANGEANEHTIQALEKDCLSGTRSTQACDGASGFRHDSCILSKSADQCGQAVRFMEPLCAQERIGPCMFLGDVYERGPTGVQSRDKAIAAYNRACSASELASDACDRVTQLGGQPRRPAKGTVTIGQPKASGGLTGPAVASVVTKHQRELQFCYDMQLRQTPELAGAGTLVLVVGAEGVASEASLDSTLKSEQLRACIAERAKRWRFSALTSTSARVEVPLSFSRRQ